MSKVRRSKQMNIPYQNMEIEQIYTQLLSHPNTAIAICAAEENEGVTSLAFALAQRNLLAGHSTLLVDLNLYKPSLNSILNIDETEKDIALLPQQQLLGSPKLVSSEHNNIVINGIVAPQKRDNIMKLRQPGALEKCIEQWLQVFDTVIIDTSPLNRVNANNIPPERVAAACDGAVLITLAGRTPEAALLSAVEKLKNNNATLLGCVFNDRDNPTLKDELIRETKRLDPRLAWLSRPLRKLISKNRLLSLEV